MATDTSSMNIVIRAFNKTGGAFKTVNTGLGKLRHSVMNLRFAMAGIAGGLMVKELIDTSVSMEKLTLGLQGATGGATEGAAEFAYLNETVDRLKLDLKTSGEAFTLLTAAARGTVLEGSHIREAFEAVAISSKVLGRSASDTKGILYAMQQMISKGTVTSEELKRQMGDRLPGAFKLAAKAMNVTERDLTDLMKTGELYTSEFLPKFTKVLMETYGNQLPAALETTQSKIDTLNTAVFRAKANLAESGFIDIIKDVMEVLAETAGSDEVSKAIGDLGETIKNNRGEIKEFFSTSAKLAADLTVVFGKLAAVSIKLANAIAGLPPGVKSLIPGLREMQAGLKLIDLMRDNEWDGVERFPIPSRPIPQGQEWSEYSDERRVREMAEAKETEKLINKINENNKSKVKNISDLYEASSSEDKLTGLAKANKRADEVEQQLRDWHDLQDELDAERLKKDKETAEKAADALEQLRIDGAGEDWQIYRDGTELAKNGIEDLAVVTNEWLTGTKAGMAQYSEYIGDIHEGMEHTVTKAFSSMEDAIVEFAMTGKTSFKDLANSIIEDMMRIMIQQSITQPLASGIMGMFGGATAIPNAFPSGGVSSLGSYGYANGGAFDNNGVIKAFASGGVVNSPTLFPFANGTGLMGEAGPEGILPLERIGSKLGVNASGGGTNVIVNNYGDAQNVDVQQNKNSQGGTDIVVTLEKELSNRIQSRGSRLSKTLESVYGVRRTGSR